MVRYEGDLRAKLKKKLVILQEMRLREQMLMLSKTDRLLLNSFNFDGKRRKYLNLAFPQARIIFMVRTRMLLTKDNFAGRWRGTLCYICNNVDTDAHLFHCPGFCDLIDGSMSYKMFFDLRDTLETLHAAATQMIMVNDRLKVVQEFGLTDVNR